jgi:hypothetical protein
MTKDRNDYHKRYNQQNSRRISLILNKKKDNDIIEAIESKGKGNIQAGVKLLIREAIKDNNDG